MIFIFAHTKKPYYHYYYFSILFDQTIFLGIRAD